MLSCHMVDLEEVKLTDKKKVEILLRFTKDNISKAIMKLNDNVGFDKIHSNHLKIKSDILREFLSQLFTSFLMHNFLPLEMIYGVITLIIKNKFGNVSDSDNYRPIMSAVLLKLFEYCLLLKIENYILLNDRQHGFRKPCSTTTACFSLKETVMYYNNASSNVYACFVDIKKAFDLVDHNILIEKLFEIGIPVPIVNMISFWYSHQHVCVKYFSCLSGEWKVSNGVRQGGVLSGLLFNVYINHLIEQISNMNIGCKLGMTRSNIVAYADYLVLLAPFASALQVLIDATNEEASVLGLTFNYSKTKVMIFRASSHKKLCVDLNNRFRICNNAIEVVSSIKYLGFFLYQMI